MTSVMALYVLFFLKVFLEWILFISLLIHTLDTAVFSFSCAFFSVSHHPWVRHLLKKKHQNNYSVNMCCEIMCCMKLLLVNCIMRHNSILQWHAGRCKEESIQNSLNWKKNLLFQCFFFWLETIRPSLFKVRILFFSVG